MILHPWGGGGLRLAFLHLWKGGGGGIHNPLCKLPPPPPCISYANVHNYYGPYAYCSLDKGVACAQHIQLPTYTCAG